MQYNSTTGEIGWDNLTRRYKIKISTLSDDWTKILQTRPVTYARPASPDHWEYGYIAEEMDSIGSPI
ncbi:MAG: tail fiber domain-containing protein [Saprospiraceae bacterium]|nr:tail fiber domain-containing protein [Saprospiraceae bacterium]